jgi:hypothetical protein
MLTKDEWLYNIRIIYGGLTEKELIKGFRYDYKNGLIDYLDKGRSLIITPVGKDSYEIKKEFFRELMDY